MAAVYQFRLFARNGSTLLGLLPEIASYQIGVEFNEVGALRLDYPATGANASLIAELCEIAVFDSNGTEYQNARYVVTGISGDRTQPSGVLSITGKSVLWLLDTALAWTKQTFSSANAGAILKPYIDAAKTRGALAGITYGFTASVDSAAAAWTVTTSGDFDARSSILSIMRTLSDQGMAEYATQGRVLVAQKVDTLGVDRTTANPPIVLQHGLNLSEAPEQKSADGMATAVLVEGDNASSSSRTNATAITTYGRLESSVSASGTGATAQLDAVGDSVLATTSAPQRQLTVGLTLQDGAPQPLVDFKPGDWVYTYTTAGIERVRVRQVTISMQAGEMTATATLGDRIYDAEVRLARTLAKLTAASRLAGTQPAAGSEADTGTALEEVATKNQTFYQTTAPTVAIDGDLWFDTDANYKLYRFNGTSWIAVQDSAAAQSTANSALTSANGKNKVTYSASAPGTTANTAGDVWFQTSGGNIIAQYQGNGGTSWTSVQLSHQVIASLDAGKITTGSLTAASVNITSSSYSLTVGSSTATAYLYVSPSSTQGISMNAVGFVDPSKSGWVSSCFPYLDNNKFCGLPALRWSTVYAATGTINTSDARLKTDISDSALGLDFVNRLRPVSYRWIVGGKEPILDENGDFIFDEDGRPLYSEAPGVRTHYGLLAQDVKEALDESDAGDFGGYVISDLDNPDSELALRYDEFIAPLIKAVQELSAQVQDLKARVETLESGS